MNEDTAGPSARVTVLPVGLKHSWGHWQCWRHGSPLKLSLRGSLVPVTTGPGGPARRHGFSRLTTRDRWPQWQARGAASLRKWADGCRSVQRRLEPWAVARLLGTVRENRKSILCMSRRLRAFPRNKFWRFWTWRRAWRPIRSSIHLSWNSVLCWCFSKNRPFEHESLSKPGWLSLEVMQFITTLPIHPLERKNQSR